ncbi:AraC family transcriptional regulator [Pseudactinotalea sp.]|uniref:helix-turn-helix transcriptional regulator n=1 Tax=Pseudactinotalea sp. TaxID=1926260 RepID=UPI003B3B97D9
MPATTQAGQDDDWADISVRPIMVGLYSCDPSWDLPRRQRAHYQVWAVTSGVMDFRIGTDRTEHVGERSLIILPPRVPQRASYRDGRLQTYVTHFMAFDHGVPNLNLWQPGIIRSVPVAAWERIVAELGDLARAMAGPPDSCSRSSRLLASAALTGVLGRIESLPERPAARQGSIASSPSVAAAIEYVRAHPDAPLSTRVLAAHVHLSSAALRTNFRRAVGQSPGEFVKQYRLSVAKSLLRESSLSVAAIGRRAGYPDPFYFSRVFRASEGVPPSQWRESLDDTLNAGSTAIDAAGDPRGTAMPR